MDRATADSIEKPTTFINACRASARAHRLRNVDDDDVAKTQIGFNLEPIDRGYPDGSCLSSS